MTPEPCPPHLDADAQELWRMARHIIEGTTPSSADMQLQALWLCRELRAEGDATTRERARCAGIARRYADLTAVYITAAIESGEQV